MKKRNYYGLKTRDELASELATMYSEGSASIVTAIIGNHGSGKTYTMYEVLNKLQSKKIFLKKLDIYITNGEKLTEFSKQQKGLSEIQLSASLEKTLNLGLAISKQNEEDQYNKICNTLNNLYNRDVLVCLPSYSNSSGRIKLLIRLLLDNLTRLNKKFKHKLFFLLTDLNEDYIYDFMSVSSIREDILQDYNETDIYNYFNKKHGKLLDLENLEPKLTKIKNICASNLKLIEFMYIDFLEKDLDFFSALDSIVSYRLNQLKVDGEKKNINKYDMEDIILSASISLQKFGSMEISTITRKNEDDVQKCFYLASEQKILLKDSLNFYLFMCNEIKEIFQKELTRYKKERYLDFYNFYTQYEQDAYFIRAHYLFSYNQRMSNEAFCLFMLAYADAFLLSDTAKIKKIESYFENANLFYQEDLKRICEFFIFLENENISIEELEIIYNKMQKDYFEIPLAAELMRTYFHYLYQHCPPWDERIKIIIEQLIIYSKEEIYLNILEYPIKINKIDESIIRLKIIYDIAPYILDSMNDTELFQELYQLSINLSKFNTHSHAGNRLAAYMENVFNRKAFLFVNQMQCGIYYQKAKNFFYRNQIWDEYCITLICEAGTDIVIRRYSEAIKCCRDAKFIAEQNNIIIPFSQKMKNNYIIADFLNYESQHSEKLCYLFAKRTVKKLRKLLTNRPCATEFVIVTNICSLSLYGGDTKSYICYKSYLEKIMSCNDVSDIFDDDIDDFYRYHFAWFETYKLITEQSWEKAYKYSQNLRGFVPALYKKQEIFWDKKLDALDKLIRNKITPSAYSFCLDLVSLKRRESQLAQFFCRGLMVSDLQYTSYI